MKKLMFILILCSSNAQAHDWVLPLVGGVVIGSVIGNSHYDHRPYYEPRPYYQPPAPVYYPPNYGGSP